MKDKTLSQLKSELLAELREKCADMEHRRWAGWQKHVHSKCVEHSSGDGKFVCFPAEYFRRWEKQIITSYSKLTELEKESDRKEVDKYLPLLSSAIDRVAKRTAEATLNEAIAIFEKLPENEAMTKNPVILELKVLWDKWFGREK